MHRTSHASHACGVPENPTNHAWLMASKLKAYAGREVRPANTTAKRSTALRVGVTRQPLAVATYREAAQLHAK